MAEELLETMVRVDPSGIAVTLSGNAESTTADRLNGLIDDVHRQAQQAGREVRVDLRALRFATSSCLRVLANWIMQVTGDAHPYRIVFLSNPQHSWQRRSLGALVAASNGMVEVRAEA